MKKIKVIFAFILALSFLILATHNNNDLFGGKPLDGNNTAAPTSLISEQPQNTGENTQTASPVVTPLPEKASSYLPFNKDIHMKYKGSGNEYASFDTYVDYTKVDTMQIKKLTGGTDSVIVYQLIDGAVRKVFTKGDTYYHYDYTTSRNNDEVLIKEPIKAGTAWKLKDGSDRSITAVNKAIKTPAGDFTTIEVTTKKGNTTQHDYYSKGTGLIKTEFLDGSNNAVTSELEKIEKDVPFKQTIKIYFPQFPEEKVSAYDREISIKTNEDMKFKFQKEFKTLPAGIKTKVLSDNVQIKSIRVDDTTGIVTADFSADLVKNMNAGAGLESLILRSITNTLGKYYQKDKVIITVEGKPYESGHILMKSGEYFTVKE